MGFPTGYPLIITDLADNLNWTADDWLNKYKIEQTCKYYYLSLMLHKN